MRRIVHFVQYRLKRVHSILDAHMQSTKARGIRILFFEAAEKQTCWMIAILHVHILYDAIVKMY